MVRKGLKMKTTKFNIESAVNIASAAYVNNTESKLNFYLRMFGVYGDHQCFDVYDTRNQKWLSSGEKLSPGLVLDDIYEGGWKGGCLYESLLTGFNAADNFWWVDPDLYDQISSTNAESLEEVFIEYLLCLTQEGEFSEEKLNESISRIAKAINS